LVLDINGDMDLYEDLQKCNLPIIYIHYGKIPSLYNINLDLAHICGARANAYKIKMMETFKQPICDYYICEFRSLNDVEYSEYFHNIGGPYTYHTKDKHINNKKIFTCVAIKDNKIIGSLWARYDKTFVCYIIELVHIVRSIPRIDALNLMFDLVEYIMLEGVSCYFKNEALKDFMPGLCKFLNTVPNNKSHISW
jgi:hypothetical protein